MNTIRWCKTHNRHWADCPFDGRPHDLVDQVRLDPSDPEQIDELLIATPPSLGRTVGAGRMTAFTEAAATLKTIASKIPPPIRGLATFLLIYGAFFAAAIWFEIIYTIIPAAIFVAAFTIRQ